MADALHNTNDDAALLIAYIARKISRKGTDKKFTFGYRRAELIGAMIQLTALILPLSNSKLRTSLATTAKSFGEL